MSKTYAILVLPGDGIGPEVTTEAVKVAKALASHGNMQLTFEEGLIGGIAFDKTGNPYPDTTRAAAAKADAVLLGAVGGPKWDGGKVPFNKRPEQGLLDLRAHLNAFANLRPAVIFESLLEASSLKPAIAQTLDVLIVRELIGGIYFGTPRGIEPLENGEKRGFNTTSYSTSEVTRIAHAAFTAAGKRRKKVTSVDKANVLESSIVWREVMTEVGKQYPDIQLEHMYIDNAAMQLASRPGQFDVIAAPNLAGDILSDLAAALTGSLGLLPSASVGDIGPDGLAPGVYEPVHGSAPDIAGKGLANPIAAILSVAMLFEHSLGRADLAAHVYSAVNQALVDGNRTTDLMRNDSGKALSTRQMGDAILGYLATRLQKAS